MIMRTVAMDIGVRTAMAAMNNDDATSTMSSGSFSTTGSYLLGSSKREKKGRGWRQVLKNIVKISERAAELYLAYHYQYWSQLQTGKPSWGSQPRLAHLQCTKQQHISKQLKGQCTFSAQMPRARSPSPFDSLHLPLSIHLLYHSLLILLSICTAIDILF